MLIIVAWWRYQRASRIAVARSYQLISSSLPYYRRKRNSQLLCQVNILNQQIAQIFVQSWCDSGIPQDITVPCTSRRSSWLGFNSATKVRVPAPWSHCLSSQERLESRLVRICTRVLVIDVREIFAALDKTR